MAVSKRLRFEILRRDGHQCRYCGRLATDGQLTVDHVVPVSLGGSDAPSNLVAACRDCNAGKAASNPDVEVVAQVADDALRWAAAIAEAAREMLGREAGRGATREAFRARWVSAMGGTPLPPDWTASVDQFVASGLPAELLLDCIDVAARAGQVHPENRFRYVCGVAWTRIRELQTQARRIVGQQSPAGVVEVDPEDDDGGRVGLACELLGFLAPDDRDAIIEESRRWLTEDAEEEPGQDDVHIYAAIEWWMRTNARVDLLEESLADLLRALPAELVATCRTEARDYLQVVLGENAKLWVFEAWVAQFVARKIRGNQE